MLVTQNPIQFSYESVRAVKRLSEFQTAFSNGCFIEITDCSPQESIDLIIKYIEQNDPLARIVHIGKREAFESKLPERLHYLCMDNKMLNSEKTVASIMRINPDLILIRHDFVDYMSRDVVKQLHLTGHKMIFY